MKHAIKLLVGLLLCASIGHAPAQVWPAKPVRLVVANNPGGASDIVARLMAEHMSKAFARQFVVENLAAGSGMVGAQTVARAQGDGYTLLFATSATLVTNPLMMKSLTYDAQRDFAPIALIIDSAPLVLALHPEVRAGTTAELIALAKSQPGKLSCATDTPRGYSAIIGELFNRAAGTNIVQVPYKTAPQAVQDTVAGRTQVVITAPGSVEAFVKSGKLKLLAITSAKRFPGLQDVPAVAETLPGFRVEGWFALVGPAGAPAEVVDKLNRETLVFLKQPGMVERLLPFGAAAVDGPGPRGVGEFIAAERERWSRIMKEVGIEPE